MVHPLDSSHLTARLFSRSDMHKGLLKCLTCDRHGAMRPVARHSGAASRLSIASQGTAREMLRAIGAVDGSARAHRSGPAGAMGGSAVGGGSP